MLNLAEELRSAAQEHLVNEATAIQERREYARSLADALIAAGIQNVKVEDTATAAKISFASKHFIDFSDKHYEIKRPDGLGLIYDGFILQSSFLHGVSSVGGGWESSSHTIPLRWSEREHISSQLKSLVVRENLISVEVELPKSRDAVTAGPIFD